MTVRDWIDTEFEEVIVASGCSRPDTAVYDHDKCVAVLVQRDGMDQEEAEEFMDFNVTGAYVEGGPMFIRRTPEE